MIEKSSEQFNVAQRIREQFAPRFDVLVNSDAEEHFIGQMFPDVILLDKQTKNPLFIIEIKRNGTTAACMKQWKSQPHIPATLYMVVPKTELENAKSMSAYLGLNTRFGYYSINPETKEVTELTFD